MSMLAIFSLGAGELAVVGILAVVLLAVVVIVVVRAARGPQPPAR
jgi:hypothetical protein